MKSRLLGTWGIAWRNLVRSFSRRWPVIVILAGAVSMLEIGNTLLDNASEGMRRTYTTSFSGDWTVSAKGRESFTLFGSDLPLIGEYYVLPTIPDAEQRLASIRKQPGVYGAVGQVSAGGLLTLDRWSQAVPVFGVDFQDYFTMFPALELISGSLAAGPGRLLLNESQFRAVSRALKHSPAIGETFTITSFNDSSFTIRPVVLAGVYRYPARDELIDRIVLTDPDTARALNGYVYGASQGNQTSQGMAAADVDGLFSAEADKESSEAVGISTADVESALKDRETRDAQNRTVSGSWNFLLVRGAPPSAEGLQVRDWKDSAGANALVAWMIQLVFNIGMGAVLFGAAIVGMNSLALSVSERTREIGTMRALGAGKLRVAALVAAEVLLTVAGAGALGVTAGILVLTALAVIGVPLSNPYLQVLFGTNLLRPHPTWAATASHLVLVAGLGLVSGIQPIRLALRIRPAQAIARGG